MDWNMGRLWFQALKVILHSGRESFDCTVATCNYDIAIKLIGKNIRTFLDSLLDWLRDPSLVNTDVGWVEQNLWDSESIILHFYDLDWLIELFVVCPDVASFDNFVVGQHKLFQHLLTFIFVSQLHLLIKVFRDIRKLFLYLVNKGTFPF